MSPVLFETVAVTPRLVVISKHPGVSFHQEEGQPGLVDAVRAAHGPVWPVHRLDRITSGLLLFARDADTARQLGEAFAGHAVRKTYLALSERKPSKKQGWVKGDMEKGRGGAWRLLPSRNNPAVTRFDTCSVRPGLRLFVLWPATGRTHQLRVAMKSLGAPIIGDPLYHPQDHGPLVPDRGYLHAVRLEVELDGETHVFRDDPRQGSLFLDPAFRSLLSVLDLAVPG